MVRGGATAGSSSGRMSELPRRSRSSNGIKRVAASTEAGKDRLQQLEEDENNDDEEEEEDDDEEEEDDDEDNDDGRRSKVASSSKKRKINSRKRNATSTGRKKVAIEFIGEKCKRAVSFTKRKAGLMKKAVEITTLTGAQCLVLLVSESGIIFHYATPRFRPFLDDVQGIRSVRRAVNGRFPIFPTGEFVGSDEVDGIGNEDRAEPSKHNDLESVRKSAGFRQYSHHPCPEDDHSSVDEAQPEKEGERFPIHPPSASSSTQRSSTPLRSLPSLSALPPLPTASISAVSSAIAGGSFQSPLAMVEDRLATTSYHSQSNSRNNLDALLAASNTLPFDAHLHSHSHAFDPLYPTSASSSSLEASNLSLRTSNINGQQQHRTPYERAAAEHALAFAAYRARTERMRANANGDVGFDVDVHVEEKLEEQRHHPPPVASPSSSNYDRKRQREEEEKQVASVRDSSFFSSARSHSNQVAVGSGGDGTESSALQSTDDYLFEVNTNTAATAPSLRADLEMIISPSGYTTPSAANSSAAFPCTIATMTTTSSMTGGERGDDVLEALGERKRGWRAAEEKFLAAARMEPTAFNQIQCYVAHLRTQLPIPPSVPSALDLRRSLLHRPQGLGATAFPLAGAQLTLWHVEEVCCRTAMAEKEKMGDEEGDLVEGVREVLQAFYKSSTSITTAKAEESKMVQVKSHLLLFLDYLERHSLLADVDLALLASIIESD